LGEGVHISLVALLTNPHQYHIHGDHILFELINDAVPLTRSVDRSIPRERAKQRLPLFLRLLRQITYSIGNDTLDPLICYAG
jgi:hypothetical protein